MAGERPDPDEAAEYHVVQVRSFVAEGVDLVHAMTITSPEEAIRVARAARSAGLPVAVSGSSDLSRHDTAFGRGNHPHVPKLGRIEDGGFRRPTAASDDRATRPMS